MLVFLGLGSVVFFFGLLICRLLFGLVTWSVFFVCLYGGFPLFFLFCFVLGLLICPFSVGLVMCCFLVGLLICWFSVWCGYVVFSFLVCFICGFPFGLVMWCVLSGLLISRCLFGLVS